MSDSSLVTPAGAGVPAGFVARAALAIAEAIFSSDAGPPPGDRLAWTVAEFDDLRAHAGPKGSFVLLLSVLAVTFLAPLFVLRIGPLGALPLARRVEALTKLEASPLSGPLLAVKAMLCILYYEHPDAQREVGFSGGCLADVEAAERPA